MLPGPCPRPVQVVQQEAGRAHVSQRTPPSGARPEIQAVTSGPGRSIMQGEKAGSQWCTVRKEGPGRLRVDRLEPMVSPTRSGFLAHNRCQEGSFLYPVFQEFTSYIDAELYQGLFLLLSSDFLSHADNDTFSDVKLSWRLNQVQFPLDRVGVILKIFLRS